VVAAVVAAATPVEQAQGRGAVLGERLAYMAAVLAVPVVEIHNHFLCLVHLLPAHLAVSALSGALVAPFHQLTQGMYDVSYCTRKRSANRQSSSSR
jgi:hypothetical protein